MAISPLTNVAVDTTALQFTNVQAKPATEYNENPDAPKEQKTTKDGIPLWECEFLVNEAAANGEIYTRMATISVPSKTPPALGPVALQGVRANYWTNGRDRSSFKFSCTGIAPVGGAK